LNRTNLTLSALSNRLNLGTRSLVLGTGVNHGGNTLRLRHYHHDVMRDRMVWYVVSSFGSSKYDIPPMPDSIIPGPQQRPIRCAPGAEASRPASVCRVEPEAGRDWSVMPTASRRGELESPSSRPMPKALPGQSAARKQRPGRCSRSAGIGGRADAARPTAGSAKAAIAAAAEA